MDPGKHPGGTAPVGDPPGGLDFRIASRQSLTLNGNIFHILVRFLRLQVSQVDGILSAMRLVRPTDRDFSPGNIVATQARDSGFDC